MRGRHPRFYFRNGFNAALRGFVPCDFCTEVARTVTYRRKIYVEVEETAERLADAEDPRWRDHITFSVLAMVQLLNWRKNVIAGREPSDKTEYEAVSSQAVESGQKADEAV